MKNDFIKIDRSIAIAPMIDWTHRHFRYFMRLISQHVLLYTEMITTSALLRGDSSRLLDFSEIEHPLALQLGGSDPKALAACAKLGEKWRYDEINFNLGCPSERVKAGCFGAVLMQQPDQVADCLKAMQDSVDLPVTLKMRLGLGYEFDQTFLYEFIEKMQQTGCRVFIVHARNAVLKNFSTKDNRHLVPLRHDIVYQLVKDFPDLTFILNGGIHTIEEASVSLEKVSGVMIGRAAYKNPYEWTKIDSVFFHSEKEIPTRKGIALKYFDYVKMMAEKNIPMSILLKPFIGLYYQQPLGRHWRTCLMKSQDIKEKIKELENLMLI